MAAHEGLAGDAASALSVTTHAPAVEQLLETARPESTVDLPPKVPGEVIVTENSCPGATRAAACAMPVIAALRFIEHIE